MTAEMDSGMTQMTLEQKQEEEKAAKSTIRGIVQNYNGSVTDITTGHHRLNMSRDLVTNLTQRLSEGSVSISHQECRDIISSLLRVTLNAEHTTSDLRDFLLSPDVVSLVRSLITATGDAGVILKGMIDGVKVKGVGFERFPNYGTRLLNSWFTGDNYKPPTSPGFVLDIFVFIYKCLDRQTEVAGNRRFTLPTMDKLLLPLVVSVINSETPESINARDDNGCSALHYAAGTSRLPSVTRELLKHPGIDVNVRNDWGRTPLVFLVWEGYSLGKSHPPICSLLLSHPDTDVSIPDNNQKTVIHHLCHHLTEPESDTEAALQMILEVYQHKTVTMEMLQVAFAKLVTYDGEYKDAVASTLCIIADNPVFNAGVSPIFGDKSAVWFCIENMGDKRHLVGYKLWETLLTRSDCDLNGGDEIGNPVLVYLCEQLPTKDAIRLINHINIAWDFSKKNVVGQTVADYYKDLPRKNPALQKLLVTKCGLQQNKESTGAASVDVTKVDLIERMIDWNINPTTPANTWVSLTKSTEAFYQNKQRNITSEKVYDLSKTLKGKVCILSVPEFKSPDLKNLVGYKEDEKNLVTLWKGMGFTVLTTRYDGQYYLTAKEIEQAVKEFSSKLTATDQCAVLCILSHGGDGFIYGSDGGTVDIRKLHSYLDYTNCPHMKEKPKFVIFQTCQGDRDDAGVTASSASSTKMSAIAAAGVRLPSISDFIVCSPSMPGYTSFVWTDPAGGSVFINALISLLSLNAHDTDLQTMLTLVNAEVCKKDIPLTVTGSFRTVDRKQMPNFNSCLTKLLYFFPGIEK